MIALATGHNATKLAISNTLIPRLAQMRDGWCKEDPPMAKKLPVEADVLEYLCQLGSWHIRTALETTLGDLTVIAIYHLLHLSKYTCKSCRNTLKQTVQFTMEDATFFTHQGGWLHQLPCNAANKKILMDHSTTLK